MENGWAIVCGLVGGLMAWLCLRLKSPVRGSPPPEAVSGKQRASGTDILPVAPASPKLRRERRESNMTRAAEMIKELAGYLEQDGMRFTLRDDEPAIEAAFRLKSLSVDVRLLAADAPLRLCALVALPLIVPEDRRPAMAEAVTRANYGMWLGNFDLGMSDGRLGFRIAIPVADGTLTLEQFRYLIGIALSTVDRYHRAFCRLVYADDLSPAEVIAEVEMAVEE